MDAFERLSRARAKIHDSGGWLRALPPLVARYVVGMVFVSAGAAKLRDLGGAAGFFDTLGIPSPTFMAGLVGVTELVCGGLLLLGLATRVATIPLMTVMTVALATAKAEQIAGLTSLFATTELGFLVLLLYLLVIGPGELSADTWFAYRLEHIPRSGGRAWTAPSPAVRPAEG